MPGPEVLLSGFADEGPVDKAAVSQLTMLAALGMGYYSLRFVDVGGTGDVKNVMQLNKSEVRRLRRLHEDFGIQVASIGSPIGQRRQPQQRPLFGIAEKTRPADPGPLLIPLFCQGRNSVGIGTQIDLGAHMLREPPGH